MNYRFDVKSDMPVNLVDWAMKQREQIDKDNELLQSRLFGGLKNVGKAGVYSKMYGKQKDEYAAAMEEIYNTKEADRPELFRKYGINPKDFADYANIQDKYKAQVNQRKAVDSYLRTPQVEPMDEDDLKLHKAFGL